jgi:hypothetical protein
VSGSGGHVCGRRWRRRHRGCRAITVTLAALDGSYGYLRQFTPQVLATVRFAGGTAATGLLEAVEILRELNATGARRVPDHAPDGFVPTRWRGYLDTARITGNSNAYRHYWELCVLLALRDALRSGDVHVDDVGSWPGIQVEHEPVRNLPRAIGADGPLWYVQFEHGQVGRPHQRG